MEIKIQKTIPLINLSNNKSEIKTLKIIEIKNGNKSKIIELFDNSNIKKSDLESLAGEEKFALDNYLSKVINSENVVIDESPVLPFKPYSIKKRSDEDKWNLHKIKSEAVIDKVHREKGFNYTIKDVYDEMNKENKLDLPDENEAIKEALRTREINKFSIPFDNTFLNTIKNKKQEEQTYLIGKYAFIEFLKKNNLNYNINEDSIFVLTDLGLKIKISTKIWNTDKETKEIFNKIKNDKNEITSISIGKDYIEKAKEFSKLLVEKGIISKKDYNNNNLSLEENKYNNSVQGKFAEMAFYDFLKSKNIATKKDWDDMLTVLDTNYDFGDFRLPNNKIIDVKSYTYFSEKEPLFPFSTSHLTKDIDYFVFSVINGIQETKYDKKDFNKNEYKVDFYGFIDRYKIKTLIKEGKIKTIHNSKNNEFCLIPWKYMKSITEIYQS